MKLWKVILICFPIALLILAAMTIAEMAIKKSDNKNYKITYELDGGTNSKNNPSTYTKTSNDIVLANATKTGFDFLGWYKEESFENKIETITKGSKGNITLYAKYGIINYAITYELDGGTNSSSNPTTYTVESNITLSDPTKNGYDFLGWYTENTFENKVDKINKGSIGDLTLYAKFRKGEYTITYTDTLDAINNNPTTYNVDTETFTLINLEKEGYDFLGWTSDTITTPTLEYIIEKGSTGNKIIKANFEAKEYSITYELYDKGDNSSDNVLTFKFNSFITLYEPTPHAGYTFDSWYTYPSFDDEMYRVNCGLQQMTLAMNYSYYAHFVLIDYTITYELDGGKNATSNPGGYIVDGDTIVLADATKLGYDFIGWYTTNTFDEESKVEKIESGSTGDITLYAKFVLINYNINYELNGGTNGANPDTYTILDEITLEDASKENYKFVGWYKTETFDEESKITTIELGSTGELTLYAKFIGYSLTTSIDNVEAGSVTLYDNEYFASGETVNLTITLNDGYSFLGWYIEDECISNKESFAYTITENDVSIIAKTALYTLDIKQRLNNGFDEAYLVTFESNGGTTYEPEYSNNLMFKLPKKDGFAFIGWYTNSSFEGSPFDFEKDTITEETTLYARWIETSDIIVPSPRVETYLDKAGEWTNYYLYAAKSTTRVHLESYCSGYKNRYILYVYDENYDEILHNSTDGEIVFLDTYFDVNIGEIFYIRIYFEYEYWGYGHPGHFQFLIEERTEMPKGGYDYASTTKYNKDYCKAGGTVKLTANPKNGTTFMGWYVDDKLVSTDETFTYTMPYKNVVIWARYEYFTVTLNKNIDEAGTVSDYNNKKIKVGSSVTIEATCNEEYAFIGWYLNDELVTDNLKYTFTMENNDYVYEARYVEVVVELTKNIEEAGNLSISKNLVLGKEATITATVNYGYIFIGWYKNSELVASTLDYEFVLQNENVFEARYIENRISISKYLDETGSISDYNFGYLLNQELELTFTINEGYTWYGWYLDGELLSEEYTITITITNEEHEYVAKAEKYVLTITPNLDNCCRDYAIITFDSKGGSEVSSQKSYEAKYIIPTKNKALFAGWYLDEDCNNEFKFDQTLTDDITLYAKWIDVDCGVLPLNTKVYNHIPETVPSWNAFYPLTSGEVTFNIPLSYYGFIIKVYASDKETIIKSYEHASTKKESLTLTFEVEAYNLYYITARQYYANPSTTYSNWSIDAKVYDVTCSTSRSGDIITYDEKVNLFVKPNVGYTFNGWYLDGELVSSNYYYSFTMPEESIEYEPRFSKNKTTYTVNHLKEDLDGDYETESTETLEGYTSELTEAITNTYTGFTAQDFEQQKINGDGSTIINIYYKRNVNTISVVITNTINDSIPATVDISSGSYKFDKEVTLTLTINDGYDFIGWYNGEIQVSTDLTYTFNMPNKKLDLEARFASKSVEYTVEYWLENANDADYTKDVEATETLSGYVGNLTEAVVKTYDWFNTPTVNQTTISASGTKIRINYTRKQVNEVRIGINIDRNESNGKYGRINCPDGFWPLEFHDMNTGVYKYLVHNDYGVKYGFAMSITANMEDGYSLEGLYINGVKLDSFTYEVNPNDADEYGLIVIAVRVNVRYSIKYYYQNNINEWIADNTIDITYDEDSNVDYAWIKEGELSNITSESELNIKEGYEFHSVDNRTINNPSDFVKVYCTNKKYSFEHKRNNGYYAYHATLYNGSNIYNAIDLYFGQTVYLQVEDSNQQNVSFAGFFVVGTNGVEEEITYTIDNEYFKATFNMIASDCTVYARFVVVGQIEFYQDGELVETGSINLLCQDYYNFNDYKNKYEGYSFVQSTVQEGSDTPFVVNDGSTYYFKVIPELGTIVVRIYYETNE